MPAIGLVLMIQAICVTHCVRGRAQRHVDHGDHGLPLIGSAAYAWFEILPNMRAAAKCGR